MRFSRGKNTQSRSRLPSCGPSNNGSMAQSASRNLSTSPAARQHRHTQQSRAHAARRECAEVNSATPTVASRPLAAVIFPTNPRPANSKLSRPRPRAQFPFRCALRGHDRACRMRRLASRPQSNATSSVQRHHRSAAPLRSGCRLDGGLSSPMSLSLRENRRHPGPRGRHRLFDNARALITGHFASAHSQRSVTPSTKNHPPPRRGAGWPNTSMRPHIV
jgi:hypothetical protein